MAQRSALVFDGAEDFHAGLVFSSAADLKAGEEGEIAAIATGVSDFLLRVLATDAFTGGRVNLAAFTTRAGRIAPWAWLATKASARAGGEIELLAVWAPDEVAVRGVR